MKVRYDDLRSRLWSSEVGRYESKNYFWWRDLVVLCANPRGILHNITFKIGICNVAQFRNSCWLGRYCLVELYPMMYQEIAFKNDIVHSMGSWRGNTWSWDFIRAQELLGQEASTELAELQYLLLYTELQVNSEDVILWPFDVSKFFTVSS